MNYTVISRELISAIEFCEFDSMDYHGFSGVESPIPLIGELESEGILMIIDGDHAELYAFDSEGNMEVVDSCENINLLPHKSARDIEIEKRIAALKAELAELENELCY